MTPKCLAKLSSAQQRMTRPKIRPAYWRVQLRRTAIVVSALILTLPAASRESRSLIGVWLIQPTSPPGVVVHESLTFFPSEGQIAGKFDEVGRRKTYDGAVREVVVDGDSVSFKVQREWGQLVWEGHFDSDNELLMESFYVGSSNELVPLETRVARRSSAGEVAREAEEVPRNLILKKMPLPPLRDLPSNGLAPTPPMGWSSWNTFKETIDEKTVREAADALVSSGAREAGYTIVEVDDGWQGKRDDSGVLHPNSKFPDMEALVHYIHSKGLKFGIYTAIGSVSCAGYVGSHGYEVQDAQTFAAWGADFVMNDLCGGKEIYKTRAELQALHQKMAEALRSTARPIIYKIHDAVDLFPDSRDGLKSWGRAVGANLWRTGDDLVFGERWKAVSTRFDKDGNPADAGPGGWNDADNLVIGVDSGIPAFVPLTPDESRTHMTLWSILASPLILGNDVRKMTGEVKEILLNAEVIAVDQDRLGKQGRRVLKNGNMEVWVKPLSGGASAVALFNRGEDEATLTVKWADIGLQGNHRLRDLWHRRDLDDGHPDRYSARVAAHGCVLLRVQ